MAGNIRPYRGVYPEIGRRVYIDPTAVVIGYTTLGDDVSVWPSAAIRGDVHRISVGARTNVQDGAVLHVTHDSVYAPGGRALIVGDDVVVGHRAVLHACTIGNRCLIGMGSIVLDGAVVGDDVMIAAGAVVTPNTKCESRSLYVGSPARRARELTEREVGMLVYMAGKYVQLKDEYLAAKA